MGGFLAVLGDSVEFANPEYLAIVPIAGLLLVFGLLVFALRLQLRPVRTEGSKYPFFGHVKLVLGYRGSSASVSGRRPSLLGLRRVQLQAW